MKFAQDFKSFASSKTNWNGLTMVVMSIIGYMATDHVSIEVAAAGVFNGLGYIFVKDAISKVVK